MSAMVVTIMMALWQLLQHRQEVDVKGRKDEINNIESEHTSALLRHLPAT